MDDFNPWYVVLILAVGILVLSMVSCVKEINTPEYKAEQAAKEKECLTPVLISEAEDVKLYAINYKASCPGRTVYFSKSGTHTTHTVRSCGGKCRRTIDDDVSNEGQP